MNVIERFWSNVNKTETCWLWTAGKTSAGYGTFYAGGGRKNRENIYAHRFVMRLAGISLDENEGHHACPNKNCVRLDSDHVQVVPRQHNPDSPSHLNRLKTHCVRGHPLFGKNLMRRGRTRACRACISAAKKERRNRMTPQDRKREASYTRNYLRTHPKQYKKMLAQMKKQKRWLLPEVKKKRNERLRRNRATNRDAAGTVDTPSLELEHDAS